MREGDERQIGAPQGEIRDESFFTAKERFGLMEEGKRNVEDGENAEGDAEGFFAWRSWRLVGSDSSPTG